MLAHGIYGYFGDDQAYLDAITWWMQTRHGWSVDPKHIFTTHGLVNGTALCVDAFTQPGDGVVLTTPVYHAFARVIKSAGRHVVECPLKTVSGQYVMDFEAWDAQMTGAEKMFILCSPHNPGGRVWTREELQGVADFCKRHDLVLVSDEIHSDLVMPGHKHHVMAHIAGVQDRLVMMTASTKTFNIAGAHIGNVIIVDPVLRQRFSDVINKENRQWNPKARNGSHWGIGQMRNETYKNLDGYKQIDWSIRYIKGRYGSMCNGWRFFQANGYH
jgi:cystathionine beta-lyase